MRHGIFARTLWGFRVAVLGWGLGLGGLMALVLAIFDTSTTTPAQQKSLIETAQAIQWYWEPTRILTPGGFATWRLSLLMSLVSIWALLAATRVTRGHEETGQLDLLLASPVSRLRLLAEQLGAVLVALLAIDALVAMLAVLGAAGLRGAHFGLGEALLEGLMVALLAFTFASLGALIAQWTRHRGAAAGLTGGLFGVAIVLNSVSMVSRELAWVGRLSPLYYLRISKPMVPGYGMNWGAAGVLAIVSLVCLVGSALLFSRRDVGSAALAPGGWRLARVRPHAPSARWSLSSLASRALARALPATLWWSLGLGGYFFMITIITRQVQRNVLDLYRGTPFEHLFTSLLGGQNASANAASLSLVFSYLPLLITAMAVTQVNAWAKDEEEGRIELVLATPHARAHTFLAWLGSATVGLLIALGAVFIAITAAAATQGFTLDSAKVAQAALGLAPWGLLTLAVGAALAMWLPRMVVITTLSLWLGVSYGIMFAGLLAGWPEWVLRLSIFWHVGTPIVSGIEWPTTGIVLASSSLALALAVWRFSGKDIGRWAHLPQRAALAG